MFVTVPLTIPNNLALVNQTLYYFAVMGENGGLPFTTRLSLTICR